MTRDAIAMFLDVDPKSFELRLQTRFPPGVQATVDRARSAGAAAERVRREAGEATAEAVSALVEISHLSLRECALVLGLSHQRVAQVLRGDS
jgi:hypothetical protein